MTEQTLAHWTLSLTREELALLIECAGATTIPTLGSSPYGSEDPAEIDRLRQAAVRSLAERGLVEVEDGAITVIDTLLKGAGAILFCVYPQSLAAVMSRYATADSPRIEAYYQTPDVTVYHLAAHAGVHELTLIAPPVDLPAMLRERLRPYEQEQPLSIGLTRGDFAQAQASAAAGDTAGALAFIAPHAPDNAAARSFVAALAEPQVRCVIEHAVSEGGRPAAIISCLISEASSWIIEGLDHNQPAGPVAVHALTAAALEDQLERLFQPTPAA
jgi:hypothetical protein